MRCPAGQARRAGALADALASARFSMRTGSMPQPGHDHAMAWSIGHLNQRSQCSQYPQMFTVVSRCLSAVRGGGGRGPGSARCAGGLPRLLSHKLRGGLRGAVPRNTRRTAVGPGRSATCGTRSHRTSTRSARCAGVGRRIVPGCTSGSTTSRTAPPRRRSAPTRSSPVWRRCWMRARPAWCAAPAGARPRGARHPGVRRARAPAEPLNADRRPGASPACCAARTARGELEVARRRPTWLR